MKKYYDHAAPELNEEAERELARNGAELALSAMGVAICLYATLGDAKEYPEELIKCVPEDLYREAIAFAPEATHKDETSPEAIIANEIKNFTPQRGWPFALVPTLYKRAGCDSDGFIPDTKTFILHRGKDFPEEWRSNRLALAMSMHTDLSESLEQSAAISNNI